MTLRPKICANSSHNLKKLRVRICNSIRMPILSDSSRGPAGNKKRKLALESKRHIAVRNPCQPHRKKPTWADDYDSACAIGTKATCAALCKVALYRKLCVDVASAFYKANQDRHSWVVRCPQRSRDRLDYSHLEILGDFEAINRPDSAAFEITRRFMTRQALCMLTARQPSGRPGPRAANRRVESNQLWW